MTARRLLAQSRMLATTAALIALGGCATFGGNVKGSFSCTAPDGICAPTASIDDRALAMISGDVGAPGTAPAGSYQEPGPKARPLRIAAAGPRVQLDRIDARRTQERVLRIVFQPYIDEQGRLHEASAIHAVVQAGEWQQQTLATATAIPDRNAQAAAPAAVSLSDAVDRADGVDVSAIDPDLPDPAAVAAARARASDPVAAIKSDVAARLAPKAGRTPPKGMRAKGAVQRATPQGAGAVSLAPAPPAAPAPGGATGSGSPLRTVAGGAAAARIKGSPEYQARADQAEEVARKAGTSNAGGDQTAAGKATVRASGFPSTVPEDK